MVSGPDFSHRMPDWRLSMEYLVPVERPNAQCTPCMRHHGVYRTYSLTWVTKHPHKRHTEGELITRCPEHQSRWEQGNWGSV